MTNTNRSFDQEKVVEIIMDMHILTGVTAKRALRGGADKKMIDTILEISTAMAAMVLSELGIDGDSLKKVLTGKMEALHDAFEDQETKEANIILGGNNDAMA
jgi:hypothetical protein